VPILLSLWGVVLIIFNQWAADCMQAWSTPQIADKNVIWLRRFIVAMGAAFVVAGICFTIANVS
jgi:hypothetical protein